MRIISKFRDYYDSCATHDKDDNCFVRHTTVHEGTLRTHKWSTCEEKKLPIDIDGIKFREMFGQSVIDTSGFINPALNEYKVPSYCYDALIGFCGIFYKVRVYATDPSKEQEVEAFYTYPKIDKFYKSVLTRHQYRYYHNKRAGYYQRKTYAECDQIYFRVQGFHIPEYEDFFNQLKTSVFMIKFWNKNRNNNNFELVINPCLKLLNFQKIYDAYTACQEIEMYQFGVIGNVEKDTIDIDDKYLIEQKGFDPKYGFRKRPIEEK